MDWVSETKFFGLSQNDNVKSILAKARAIIWNQDSKKGSVVIGVWVMENTALATAGAIGGVPGSPTPVGGWSDSSMCTETSGISLIRRRL